MFKISTFGCALLLWAVLVCGCAQAPASGGRTVSIAEAVAAGTNTAPIRMPIFLDKSGSTLETRTPQLTVDDLNLAIGLLAKRGGELAIGEICADSNHPLIRLRLPSPRQAPVMPPTPSNVFERHDADVKMAAQHVQDGVDDQRAAAEAGAAIDRFRNQVAPLLAKAPSCRHTDVAGALVRAALFTEEPVAAGWRQPPVAFVCLVTDGLDNSRLGRIEFHGRAELLVVNGSASLGALARLHPQRFESIEAALQYALQPRIQENADAISNR